MEPGPETPAEQRAGDTVVWLVGLLIGGLAYALARVHFTHEYSAVPWKALLALDAPLPFGHRVLVPWLSRPFVRAGLSPSVVFGAFEGLSFAVVVGCTAGVLQRFVSLARARIGAVLVGVALPLVYVVPRRWPLLYPWDGLALAVLAVGVWAILERRWALALVVAAIGALNRETAVLLPLLMLAATIHDPQRRRRGLAWAQLTLAAVIVVRVAVAVSLPDQPGPPLHFTIGGGSYRVLSNLHWLADPLHLAWLVVYFGVLPLAWPLRRQRVPGVLHRIGLVGVAYFVAAQVVANIYEPRAWGEAVYLACLPAAVGLLGPTPPASPIPRWLAAVDRWTVPAIAVAFTGFVLALSTWHFLPVAQWPMPR